LHAAGDEYAAKTGQPRFVAGSMGPSGKLPSANDPELSNVTYDELADVFREQAVGLIQGGVDVLLIETSQDILEVRAAIAGCHAAFEETQVYLPIQAQVTLDTTGRMLLGTDITAALTILEGLGIDVIGLNCSTGPEHMREPIRILGEAAALPVSCIPNAGLPLNVDGQAVYPLEPQPFAAALIELSRRPHLGRGRLLRHDAAAPQAPCRGAALSPALRAAAAQRAAPGFGHVGHRHAQDPPPTLLGERLNAQGSRKFKKMLLEEDYDGILEMARDQVAGGAHALDISCAVTERPDEVDLMRNVVKKLEFGRRRSAGNRHNRARCAGGRSEDRSGTLHDQLHAPGIRARKADKILQLAQEHSAAVIILTIDEGGMAKDRQKKLESRSAYTISPSTITGSGRRISSSTP